MLVREPAWSDGHQRRGPESPSAPPASQPSSWRSTLTLFRDAAERWIDDRCDRLAAALSYYALFSLFPLALLAVTALGFFLGNDPATRAPIVASLNVTASPALSSLIDDTLASMQTHQTARGVGTIIGVATLLFGASGVFSELTNAFNLVWRAKEPPSSGVWSTIVGTVKSKFFAFLLVLFAAVALLASLIASTALTAVQKSSPEALGGRWLWVPMELLTSTVFMAAVLTAMFHILPRAKVGWRDALIGATFTSVVFTILKKLLAYYLAHLGSYAAYGVVGALLGLLTWIYVTSMLLYFGAELTRVYAERRGTAAQPS